MKPETKRVLDLWVVKAKLLQHRNFIKTAMDRESFVVRGEGGRVYTVTSDDEARQRSSTTSTRRPST
jgi:hypothetical protein